MAVTQEDLRKWMAELVGAFLLTFAGVSAMLGGGDLVAVAVAHGGALALAVYAFGPISGAHVNPAISACLFIQKKLPARDFVFYVVFQVVGATIAAGMAALIFPSFVVRAGHDGATLGAFTSDPTNPFIYNPGAALLLEIVLTFMLATAVSIVVRGGDKFALLSGALIGGTLLFCIAWGGPWTGASLNPARSMGSAIGAGADSVVWGSIWVYWVGPLIGGVIAGIAFMWFRGDLHIGLSLSATLTPPAAAPGAPPMQGAAPSQSPLPPPSMPGPPAGQEPRPPP